MRREAFAPLLKPATASLRTLLLTSCVGLALLVAPGLPAVAGELVERLASAGRADRLEPGPADPIASAQELYSGVQTIAGNPLRKPQTEQALAELLKLAGSDDATVARRAHLAWATRILADGAPDPQDVIKAATIVLETGETDLDAQMTLAAAAERGALPDGAPSVDLEAIYRIGLDQGRADAAFGLARLQTEEAEAENFAAQGVYLLRLNAATSKRDRLMLAERLAVGDGLEQNAAEAREHFLAILSEGDLRAYSGLTALPGVLDSEADRAAIRFGLATAVVDHGSVSAARRIAIDALEQRVLGFDETDGLRALKLLAEVGDAEGTGLLALAKAIGFGGPADPAEALDLMTRYAARPDVTGRDLSSAGREIAKRGEASARAVALAALKGAAVKGVTEAARIAGRFILEWSAGDPSMRVDEALVLLQDAAAAGDARAMVDLGDLYAEGRHLERSPERALSYYRDALKQDLPPAISLRVARFLIAQGAEAEVVEEGVDLLTRVAEAGEPVAMRQLGLIYLRGARTILADESVGLSWLRQAGEAGDGTALVAIGDYLMRQDSEQKRRAEGYYEMARSLGYLPGTTALGRLRLAAGDTASARALFQEAADGGDPDALVELGRMMLGEDNLPETVAQAEALFERAEASAGDRASVLVAIGELYAASTNTDLRDRGIRLLLEQAAAGERRAFTRLAVAYSRLGPTQENADEAVRWAYRAAEAGTPSSIVTVARALVEGETLPQDTARAIQMLEDVLSREPDSVSVMLILGDIYQKAGSEYRNLTRGFDLFKRAAELGSVRAMTNTAFAYADGAGTERDPRAAYEWFVRAADSNSNVARVQLAMILSSGATVDIDPEGAATQLFLAAQNGSVRAKLELGRFLLIGFGTDYDEEAGLAYLREAADLGSSDALWELYQFYYLRGEDGDRQQAFDWLNRAANAGNTDAMLRLALTLNFDASHGATPEDVVYWLKRSAKTGKIQARRALTQYMKAGKIDPAVADEVNPDGPPPELGG